MKFSSIGARLDGAISQVVPVTKTVASSTAAKTKQATVASAVAVRNTSDRVVTRLSNEEVAE